ncbi:5-(carboxyamino)imidazole ribonucleotide synthase [Bacteroidota bacterium]
MKIGIIGGGQLGRMMAEANIRKNLGLNFIVLDPTENCPAAQIQGVSQIVGDFKNEDKIRQLASEVDILTFEIELANSQILKEIEDSGVIVAPSPNALYIIQDKLRQKSFLQKNNLPVGEFMPINSREELIQGLREYGFPSMLKASQDSYDGRGNYLIKTSADIDEALSKFEGRTLMLEKFVNFDKEISVIAARDFKGNVATYPVAENEHIDSQLNITIAPANIPQELKQKAEEIARKTMEIFDGAGVFGIEMFLRPTGEILINEMAPRVHNSGHHTIEGNNTCQFEQHLRAISEMPLGDTDQKQDVIMCNILGGNDFQGTYDIEGTDKLPEGTGLHMYGKTSKPKRKLGHITIPTTNVAYAKEVRDIIRLTENEG